MSDIGKKRSNCIEIDSFEDNLSELLKELDSKCGEGREQFGNEECKEQGSILISESISAYVLAQKIGYYNN